LHIDVIVRCAVARVCTASAAQLTAETDLTADLGLDSIDLVEAAADVEHRIDAILPDAELVACHTVGDLIGLTRRVYESQAAGGKIGLKQGGNAPGSQKTPAGESP